MIKIQIFAKPSNTKQVSDEFLAKCRRGTAWAQGAGSVCGKLLRLERCKSLCGYEYRTMRTKQSIEQKDVDWFRQDEWFDWRDGDRQAD